MDARPGLYSKIDWHVKDLLYGGYFGDSKFSIISKASSDNVVVTPSVAYTADHFLSSVKTSAKYKNIKADFLWQTDSKFIGRVTADCLAPGLKTVLTMGHDNNDAHPLFRKVEFQLQTNNVGVATSFGLTVNPTVNLNALLFESRTAAFGVDVSYNTSNANLVKLCAGARVFRTYRGADYVGTLTCNERGDCWRLSGLSFDRASLRYLGMELVYVSSSGRVQITVGSKHQLFDDSTEIKWRASSDRSLAGVVQHRMNKHATIAVSTSLDMRAPEDSRFRIGMSLALIPS